VTASPSLVLPNAPAAGSAAFACIIGRVIELRVPGRGQIRLAHLVTDVNGTLAVDGMLLEGLSKRIAALRDRLTVHLLTADTHGAQGTIDSQLNLHSTRLSPGNEQEQKRSFVAQLGPQSVIAIGQGANDALMLKEAAIGICVLSQEGTALESLMAADIVAPNITAAFDLIDRPVRMVATLRR
jgi:P-type E1-E2 ATPase